MAKNVAASKGQKNRAYHPHPEKEDVRTSNIVAAQAIADAIRTSLGPRGMDKMILAPDGEVIVSNDGATILKHMNVHQPCAKMLVELSKAQDVEAGDGTTSVTVIAGSLLASCRKLLSKGIHPTTISEHYRRAAVQCEDILRSIATPVDLKNRESLLSSAKTSLSSKVVAQYSDKLAPISVDAVLQVIDVEKATNVDLKKIRTVCKLGGTVDDTEMVQGLVFTQSAVSRAGGPTRVEGAKIGLIQFQLSPPKTNMESTIVLDSYTKMDRVFKQNDRYILNMLKVIKKSGCNVLLIQKSILRDATNEVALQRLAAMKIMVIEDIERDEIEFISETTGAIPIASIEAFSSDKLGKADVVEEVSTSEGKVVKATGVPGIGKTVSILVRGSNKMVVEEAERSIHDALCVIRSLVKERFMIAGGGAPEIEMALALYKQAKTEEGMGSYCLRAFGEALEVIPETLAENAGLNPVKIVTELRNKHASGNKNAGIDVKKGTIEDMVEQNVVQPLLVSMSAIKLATETVALILKIDGTVETM